MANGSGIYGRGLTKSSILQSLMETDNGKEGSYWDETLSDINKGYSEVRDVYSSQFNEAVDLAYAARRRRENLINMSTVIGGGKQALLGQADKSYEQAYDTYRQNLAERNQALSESYSQDVEDLQNLLNERAENFADFGNLHYDYLEYLYNKYYSEPGEATGPWTNDIFRTMYIYTDTNPDGVPVFDEEGNPATDENGNPLYEHLRSRQSLYNVSYYEGSDMYNSIYDEEGYLTPFGRQYFDMIENMEYGSDAETFGDWLYNNNQEIWEYMYESPNIFDSTSDSTNAGTFRELTGRDAKDYTYSIAEHFSAIPEGTIKSYFNNVYDNIDKVFEGNLKDRGQSAIDASGEIVDQLEKLTKDLGLEKEFGSNEWNALRSAITKADEYIKSGGEMTADWFNTTIATELEYAGPTTAAGAFVGSLIPVVGTGAGAASGLAAGGLVGFIYGVIKASMDTNAQRKQNEQYATELKNQLQSITDNIVAYSLSKHDENGQIQKYLDEIRQERAEKKRKQEYNEQQLSEDLRNKSDMSGLSQSPLQYPTIE